jgi:hypothetical protein
VTTIDPDVAGQPTATDTGDTTATTPLEPVVRIDGELAGRLLASARWQQ